MVSHAVTSQPVLATPTSLPFDRFAGSAAILTGITGFVYAIAFVVLQNAGLSALCLMLIGVFSLPVLVALYEYVKGVDAASALWALLLGSGGALGALLHGGYDLANVLHPPLDMPSSIAGLPSPVDPRGLLTFGIAGVGLIVMLVLMKRTQRFSTALIALGALNAVLLILLYLGRLIVLDASSPLIIGPAVLNGFLVNPLWYLWLGFALWRGTKV